MRQTKLDKVRECIQVMRRFIAECNSNRESSYWGENGPAVIESDLQALWRLQAQERQLAARKRKGKTTCTTTTTKITRTI